MGGRGSRSKSGHVAHWIAIAISTALSALHAGACGGLSGAEPDAGVDASTPGSEDAGGTEQDGFTTRDASPLFDAGHETEDGWPQDAAGDSSSLLDGNEATEAGGDAVSDAVTDVAEAGIDAPSDAAPDAACMVCGSQCVDLQTSSTNCGYCNHDCQGGQCKGAVCQPVVLQLVNSPEGIALDSASIYYTENATGTVWIIPKRGGIRSALATDQPGPAGIVVDSTAAYWTNAGPVEGGVMLRDSGTIVSMPLPAPDGGAPFVIASGQDIPFWAIAVDSTTVYWTTSGASFGKGTLMSAPLDGGPPTTLASGIFDEYSIAIDTLNVYWPQEFAPDGSVMEVPKTGGAATTLVPFQFQPVVVALDSTSLYWIDGFTSAPLMVLDLDGGAPTVLATGLDSAGHLAIDSSNIYVAGQSNVTMVSKSSGQTTVLATSPDVDLAVAIAVDDTAVYWANFANGQGNISKVAKP